MVLKLTLLDDCFSSNVVDRKHCIKNVTEGGENEQISTKCFEKDCITLKWSVPLPSLIVVQVGKQYILGHGFGQGSHALVVFWDDLWWKKAYLDSSSAFQ